MNDATRLKGALELLEQISKDTVLVDGQKYFPTGRAVEAARFLRGVCKSFEWNKSDGICLNCGKPRDEHTIIATSPSPVSPSS